MKGQSFVNNFVTTLAAEFLTASTTPTLSSITAIEDLVVSEPSFGTLTNITKLGQFLTLTIEPDGGGTEAADYEIIRVLRIVDGGGSQDMLVTRGAEGTTARDWPAGSIVSARATAQTYGSQKDLAADRIIISNEVAEYPEAGFQMADETGFDSMVSIGLVGTAVYGNHSINVGRGGVEESSRSLADFTQPNRNSVNLGLGGVNDNGDDLGNGNSINIGDGSANGRESYNFGAGGAGPFSWNFGSGGAFPGASDRTGAAINIGDAGAYSAGGINIGNGGTGPGGDGAINIGRNTATSNAGGLAIGDGADSSHANSAAVGLNAATSQANQTHLGVDRNIEIGNASNSMGIHLYSPDGTRYKISAANGGTVAIAADPL